LRYTNNPTGTKHRAVQADGGVPEMVDAPAGLEALSGKFAPSSA
jgi:hypothetical protein